MTIRLADRSCYAAEAAAFSWTKRPLITIPHARRIIARQCEFFDIPVPKVTSRRAGRYAGRWGGGFYDHITKRIHFRPSATTLLLTSDELLNRRFVPNGEEWDGKAALIPLYTVLHECAHHACDMMGFGRGHTTEFRGMVQAIANTWGYGFKLQKRAGAVESASPHIECILRDRRMRRNDK